MHVSVSVYTGASHLIVSVHLSMVRQDQRSGSSPMHCSSANLAILSFLEEPNDICAVYNVQKNVQTHLTCP